MIKKKTTKKQNDRDPNINFALKNIKGLIEK